MNADIAEQAAEPLDPLARTAARLAQDQLVGMLDDQVLGVAPEAARVHNAPCDLLDRKGVSNCHFRIHRPQRIIGEPPRHAVEHRNDLGLRTDQRFERSKRFAAGLGALTATIKRS